MVYVILKPCDFSPISRKEKKYADKNNRIIILVEHRILSYANNRCIRCYCALGFGRSRHQCIVSFGQETWSVSLEEIHSSGKKRTKQRLTMMDGGTSILCPKPVVRFGTSLFEKIKHVDIIAYKMCKKQVKS